MQQLVTRKSATSILAAYVLSRLVCSAFVYLGHIRHPYLEEIPGGWAGVDNWWLNPWTTYDSYWYLSIAKDGYTAQSTAFFPLYPMVLKLFGEDISTMAFGGALLSHALFLLALCLIFKLTTKEHDQTVAHVTVWTLCFIPSAAFFGAVYTESLFLVLTAGTFLALRNQRWGLSAFLAALAALTRNPGLLLALVIALEVYYHPSRDAMKPSRRWITPLAPLLSFGVVQLYYWHKFGSPWSGLASQEFYHRKLMWPWRPLQNDLVAVFQPGHGPGYYFIVTLSVLTTTLAIGLVIYGVRKIPAGYLVLIGGVTMMNLVYAWTLTPSTISGIRYMGALFPFSQLLAILYCRTHRYRLITPMLVALQLFAFMVYSYNFGLKHVF